MATYEDIVYLIETGCEPNQLDKYDHSPLHEATDMGLYDVVRALLDKGANPNIGDFPPLSLIINRAEINLKVIKLLLSKGANPEAAFNDAV